MRITNPPAKSPTPPKPLPRALWAAIGVVVLFQIVEFLILAYIAVRAR